MGNAPSKNGKKYNTGELPNSSDNPQSMTTATSMNSILVNSSHQQSQQEQGVLSLPPLPSKAKRSLSLGSIEPMVLTSDSAATSGQLSTPTSEANQSTLSSQNQLSITSTRPMKKVDIDDCILRLFESSKKSKYFCLKNAEITSICQMAYEVFLSQPTLIELMAPVKILGDVHGQFQDLLRLFEMSGYPPTCNYLFLGDYVDRGKQSLETILLLLCYKIKYPENFFLLRGNHECASVTRVYGFYDECKRRVNLKIWKTFIDVFNTLPIAAVVAGKIFCVHGGLSPALRSLDDIRNIKRPIEVPEFGLLNDLLWSDPSNDIEEWGESERGVSHCFGKKALNEFLANFDLDLVCRAHMVVEDGYEFFNNRTLVTIFSAPNYCGEFDNFGAIMTINEMLLCSFELLTPSDATQVKEHLPIVDFQVSRSLDQTSWSAPPRADEIPSHV